MVKATEGGLLVPVVQQVLRLCVLVLFLCSHSGSWLTLLRKLAPCLSVCLSDGGTRVLDLEELRVGQGVR